MSQGHHIGGALLILMVRAIADFSMAIKVELTQLTKAVALIFRLFYFVCGFSVLAP